MLDQYIYDQPGHLIRRAHQVAWSVFMDETKAFDMTPVQYSLLVAVGECPSIDATRLSELIDIDRATIGNVVDRLERRGLLVRSADADDRRAKKISLTKAGRKLIEAVNKIRGKIGERILAPLDATERATFLRLVAKLVRIDEARSRARRLKGEFGKRPAKAQARAREQAQT
jgi:DNA-binding MarR family transcriptional regulator